MSPLPGTPAFPTDIIEAIKERQTPEFANADERAIYTGVKELVETHRMSDSTYSDALAHFDEHGVVDLVGIVGYYIFVALTLNGFEVPVPDAADPPTDRLTIRLCDLDVQAPACLEQRRDLVQRPGPGRHSRRTRHPPAPDTGSPVPHAADWY